MQSKAKTVEAYLAELPDDRRAAIQAVRDVILANMDSDYEEGIQYGMIGFHVPHRVYPPGYHCDPKQPLPFAGLASQKNYMSLYMMFCYGDSPLTKWFQSEWKKTGKKLDMGKSCIRFKKIEDLPLELIGEAIRRMPVKKLIEYFETALATRQPAKTAKKKAPVSKSKGTTTVKARSKKVAKRKKS
jgi:hypothetical protein